MLTFDKAIYFKGEVTVPSDKSITHRAIILSSMAEGKSVIKTPLFSRDTLATVNAFRSLGVNILKDDNEIIVVSGGYSEFKEPLDILNADNSGTTARMMAGVLAPQKFMSVITGDDSLKQRPMSRVIKPLELLGAKIFARAGGTKLPMVITKSILKPAHITGNTKSAQVKSAVLLAAAQIEGLSTYIEDVETRNHTEIMLKNFGADISVHDEIVAINGGKHLTASDVKIPSDFSSASFFIALGLIFEKSDIIIKDVSLNKTRTGLLLALKGLGVDLKAIITDNDAEPIGVIEVQHKQINGGLVSGAIIANMVDEVPILALIGLFGKAPLEIRGAAELRVKESDRIKAIVTNFRALGATVEEYDDGLKVYPLEKVSDKVFLKSYGDHRICMLNIILAKKFGTKIIVDDISSLDVSFPNFIEKLTNIEN